MTLTTERISSTLEADQTESSKKDSISPANQKIEGVAMSILGCNVLGILRTILPFALCTATVVLLSAIVIHLIFPVFVITLGVLCGIAILGFLGWGLYEVAMLNYQPLDRNYSFS